MWTWCSWFRNSWQDFPSQVESSWNVMAHDDAREGNLRGNWRMEWVASTLHTTSEHGVSSIATITKADAHNSASSNRLNWRSRRFKWTRLFRRKMKCGFCACAITFQMQSTCHKPRNLLFSISLCQRRTGHDYVPRSSSSTSFIHSHVTSSFLSSNVLLNTTFLNSVKIRSPLSVKYQVSNSYKTSKITVLCILIFIF